MATASQLLTIEEFRTRYTGIKPYYEYWNGEAVQKAMPTWLHGHIQRLIANLLAEAGYKTAVEIELRIDDDWQPVPDIVSLTTVEQPYPTKPVQIVVEILSPDDRISRVIEKCEKYSAIGTGQIFVIDPDHRGAFEWVPHTRQLGSVKSMVLSNGRTIDLQELWDRLDAELN